MQVYAITKVFIYFNFLKDFIYLFLERGEGKEKERETNINVFGCILRTPYWRPGPHPKHVP